MRIGRMDNMHPVCIACDAEGDWVGEQCICPECNEVLARKMGDEEVAELRKWMEENAPTE